ncbi:MAG: FHA domain-containing protein [Bacteroidetes bacterium]|nr:FHA domain-containing protein [Bacteroidota bacterium]
MTRIEALNFLELSEKATAFEIKQRLLEKMDYYENLCRNAPSDFLRKLNTRHVEKVKTIQQEFPDWDPRKPELSVEFPEDEMDKALKEAEVAAGLLTTPVIISSKDKRSFIKKEKFPDPPGWLIMHMEDRPSKSFALSVGNNYIGRKADPLQNPFIVIDDDSFISKVHAVVYVEQDDQLSFYIMDDALSNGGRESRNGTFVNGNPSRILHRTALHEEDTIQVGHTKLVLKVNKSSIQHIVQEVKKSKFVHTIVLGKP